MPGASLIPFLDRLKSADRILIAGCGGGFDIYGGVPLALEAKAAGKDVILANLSFSDLLQSGCPQVAPTTWRIEASANDLPYFPELWLAEWLARRDVKAPVYAFAKSGVQPLRAGYKFILESHDIDLVILIDGGTDSLLFGDEPGLGTVEEDAISLVAAHEAAGDRAVLAAIGFGVDAFHGVSHYSFLENAALLARDGASLGTVSLTKGSLAADGFLDLVEYANQRQPAHRSIVCNSIASAVRGEFGDYHATPRTSGAELFINPLMAQYWTFQASAVVARMAYAPALSRTERVTEARGVIEEYRQGATTRPRRPLPL